MNNLSVLSNLFSIQNVEENNGNILAKVLLNENSDIYKAHFPGDPITPGVCQIHLVKDVLTAVYPNKTILFKASKQMKFTEVLRPTETLEISVSINSTIKEGELIAKAQIFNLDKVYLKAQLTYTFGE